MARAGCEHACPGIYRWLSDFHGGAGAGAWKISHYRFHVSGRVGGLGAGTFQPQVPLVPGRQASSRLNALPSVKAVPFPLSVTWAPVTFVGMVLQKQVSH